MAILINLRHLETKSQQLEGECPASELDLEKGDELISLNEPLKYDLEAQLMEQAVLVQGRLELALDCECARCLKPFRQVLEIDDWACHIPLEGEEKAVVISDCVDLTPYIREDIFLAFPQRPLCDPNCSGLKTPAKKSEQSPAAGGEATGDASPWSVLDKLKL
jgi:uncharacterized protein